MFLGVDEVRAYYRNGFTEIPEPWSPKKLGRKHFRIETLGHQFLKLIDRLRRRLLHLGFGEGQLCLIFH